MEWIKLTDQLPEKGVDVELLESNGDITIGFRCNCHNEHCTEWREPLLGYGLIISPTHWRKYYGK